MTTNAEKKAVWEAYRAGHPTRTPMAFGVNMRVVILDPAWNPGGVSFEDCFSDGEAVIRVQLRYMEYLHEYLHRYCDQPVGLPKEFTFYVDVQNVYDAAYFGAPLVFRDGQVPDTEPCLAGGDKRRIFDVDIEHPLDNPFLRRCLDLHGRLTEAAAKVRHKGVAFKVRPFMLGFDGPLTVATSLRGQDIFVDLYEDPEYVRRLLEFLQRGAILRRKALAEVFGMEAFGGACFYADDAIGLISTEAYREHVLPVHRAWYAHWGAGPHGIHLCGDAARHFPLIHRELNVCSFDTGFPVDHGALRKALGPGVEIRGGPEVALLLQGTPRQVYDRTRGILRSGVREGGRFILAEANNLPPGVPEANLAAMYRCCLEHGAFGAGAAG